MIDLLEKVRGRLAAGLYLNEAAISHGVVTPIMNALGWDSSDPDELIPEFSSGRGRVDFALKGLGRRPAVFIEVKGLGRAADGDRQLFEYAFHEGVPICVLTDGDEWSFYLPGAQGSYDDRRVYLLRLSEREPAECQSVLRRYLSKERVRSNLAYEDAQRDYRDAAGRREASAALPRAWSALLDEPEDLLLELLADKAEALCGFRPNTPEVLAFLLRLKERVDAPLRPVAVRTNVNPARAAASLPQTAMLDAEGSEPKRDSLTAPAVSLGANRGVSFSVFGKEYTAPSASDALIRILEMISSRDPTKLMDFAQEAEGRSRKHIGRSAGEIYPDRHDLKVAEFYPGWFVGLNIANREKMRLIRAACSVYSLTTPGDVTVTLPNSK